MLNEEGGLVAGQQKSGTGAAEDLRDDTSRFGLFTSTSINILGFKVNWIRLSSKSAENLRKIQTCINTF